MAILLFVANLVGYFMPATQTASADSDDDYNGEIVYYMYDFYPTIRESDIKDPTGYDVYYRYVRPSEYVG